MKASFDKQKLLAAITPAAGISQTKNTLMTVEGLLFECPPNPKYGEYDTDNPNLCRISAFDLEKGLRTSVECRVWERGMAVINTSKILQIVRALPDGEVTLEIDDRGHTKISCGYSSFEITASPGDEFPSMPMFIGERSYQIPQHVIRSLIGETVFSVAQNDQRAAFNGALFRIENGCLTVVALDGNRLAAAKADISGTNETVPDAEMVIPGRFLNELSKLLRDTEDELTMLIGRKHIIFKIDSVYFFTRMLDTEYMNFEKLLPATYMTEIYVSRSEMLGAAERASLITEDKLGGSMRPHVRLEVANQSITMTSVSSNGSVFEKVPGAMSGADLTIGFTCRFLTEALRACPADCERLRIRFNSPLMGVVIEPAEGETFLHGKPDPAVFGERALDVGENPEAKEENGNPFLYFVMPVRLNG